MDRRPGKLYVTPDPQKRCQPESWVVITEGDGTLEGDTITHGIFWTKADAELFLAAKQASQDKNDG